MRNQNDKEQPAPTLAPNFESRAAASALNVSSAMLAAMPQPRAEGLMIPYCAFRPR